MTAYNVSWTRQAAIDLEEILNYIANDRPTAAASTFKKIKTKVTTLRKNPMRCRVVPELREIGITYYMELIIKPYRIIFKLTEESILVIAVVDSRRDFESAFINRLTRP